MNLTAEQETIIKEICLSGENLQHIVVRARAGTGKTSTMVFASSGFAKDLVIIAVAFNKDIAVELDEKLPDDWNCRTFHSLSYGTLMRGMKKKFKPVKKKKMSDICWAQDDADLFPDFVRAASIAKAWGFVPKGALADPRSLQPDTTDAYNQLFANYGIDTGSHRDPIGALRAALLTSISQAWQGTIDFDDQLYLPVIYRYQFPLADRLLVDEAQDVSPIQREIIRMCLKPGGRLIAIGDDKQAIYGFRGADRSSLPKIIEEFDCKILPLTTSFRCSQSVILEAQKLVPDINFMPSAPGGIVCGHPGEEWGPSRDIPDGSAILCRNNAPLMRACFSLIRNGRGATIIGRDLAYGLKKMCRKYKTQNLKELSSLLWSDIDQQRKLLEEKFKISQSDLLKDKAECIQVIINQLPDTAKTRHLFEKLDSMFDNPKALIRLSTIHKSKGLEWPDVYILDRDLIPSRWAKSPEEIEQENNLLYVAQTRAQLNLTYIASEMF